METAPLEALGRLCQIKRDTERYSQDRTEESHAAFERAVRVFADWVLRGKVAGHGTASNK